MAHGRPRQPNDPSVMASVEAALISARPGLLARGWHWRYELALTAGMLFGTIGIGVTLGPAWLAVTAGATPAQAGPTWIVVRLTAAPSHRTRPCTDTGPLSAGRSGNTPPVRSLV